jgi:hypothetical protein
MCFGLRNAAQTFQIVINETRFEDSTNPNWDHTNLLICSNQKYQLKKDIQMLGICHLHVLPEDVNIVVQKKIPEEQDVHMWSWFVYDTIQKLF